MFSKTHFYLPGKHLCWLFTAVSLLVCVYMVIMEAPLIALPWALLTLTWFWFTDGIVQASDQLRQRSLELAAAGMLMHKLCTTLKPLYDENEEIRNILNDGGIKNLMVADWDKLKDEMQSLQ